MTKYVANACWPPRSASSTRWPTCARPTAPTSTTSAAASATTSGSASSSCSPASATAAVASPRTSAPSSTWPSRSGLPARMMEAVDAVNEAQKDVLFRKIHAALRRRAQGQDDRRLGPGVQAADRRHPRGPRAGPDRRAAGRRASQLRVHDPEALANVRAIYGDRLTYCDRPYGALEAGRRPGDRHRVERVPQPRLRGDAPPAAPAGHLRRPQPLRPGAHGRAGLHLLRHRPAHRPSILGVESVAVPLDFRGPHARPVRLRHRRSRGRLRP